MSDGRALGGQVTLKRFRCRLQTLVEEVSRMAAEA
jgi:hypothetical protein